MNTLTSLESQAIRFASKQEWDSAIQTNLQILDQDPENLSGLKRLGYCYLHKGEQKRACEVYTKILELDPYCSIAKKYLELAKSKHTIAGCVSFDSEQFIEEPGKTKTATLARLADASTLQHIPIGIPCTLTVKSHWISVITNAGEYLGALPEDLSHILTKLIQGGNTYSVIVKSVSKAHCTVFIKELTRSSTYQHTPSFPSLTYSSGPQLHEKYLIDDLDDESGDSSDETDQTDETPEDNDSDR